MQHPRDIDTEDYDKFNFGIILENGNLYFDMIGTGSGRAPELNNWAGITLLGPGVQDAVDRFGMQLCLG